MKRIILTITITTIVLIFSLSCQSYQVTGTYEEREKAGTFGVGLTTEVNDYGECTFFYLFDMYPEVTGLEAQAAGFDVNLKYPFYFAWDHLSIFPIVGFESRFIFTSNENPDVPFPPDEKNKRFGLGVKFGGGLDIYFSEAFFIRGTVLYLPEFSSFYNSYQGLRINVALGYRAEDYRRF